MSLLPLEGHLTQEVGMPSPSKHDYPTLFEEYNRRFAAGESPKEIRATFESRGINWGTFQNRRTQANKAHQSTPDEPELWSVHPGTPSEEDWELWTTIKTMWPRVEKMLSDQQILLGTPMDTPR